MSEPIMNSDMFDFDAMKQKSGDPFKEESTYAKDERFYALTKDKEQNGGAIIRFLPDAESGMIQRMFKCNSNFTKDGKKRFVSEFSPQTIGLPDPFQDKWSELWNNDEKDEAKKFSRGVTFVANIKVIADPACPENVGKIFLLQMSGAIKDKIQAAMTPSEQDVALGSVPKQMFNPLKGHSFKLSCGKGANGQVNYDSSEIKQEVTSIYDSVEECLTDIKENTHLLSGLLDPKNFLSFEKLEEKLRWVQFLDNKSAPKVKTLGESVEDAPKTEVKTEATPEVKTEATPETVKTEVTTEATTEVKTEEKPKSNEESIEDLINNL